jgi:hypothetical protein
MTMEAAGFSKTSVHIYLTTRVHILEDEPATSIEQSTSWALDSSSASSHEISCILWNPQV